MTESDTTALEFPTTTLEIAPTTQGIAIFDGTEFPVFLSDDLAPRDAREYLSDTLVRSLAIHRLRYWADVLEAELNSDDGCVMTTHTCHDCAAS